MTQGTNYQQLRALLAFLGLSEEQAGTELGISRTLVRSLVLGHVVPDDDLKQRIRAMSKRWPNAEILPDDWPAPGVDRRGAPLARVAGVK
jgi:hypothetical protein